MRIFITGGASFIGSNLAAHLRGARPRHHALRQSVAAGSGGQPGVDLFPASRGSAVRPRRRPGRCPSARGVSPGATWSSTWRQVAVTTSVVNLRLDLEVNTLGTFNVPEAARGSSFMPAASSPRPTRSTGRWRTFLSPRMAGATCTGTPGWESTRGDRWTSTPPMAALMEPQTSTRASTTGHGLPTVVFRVSCICGLPRGRESPCGRAGLPPGAPGEAGARFFATTPPVSQATLAARNDLRPPARGAPRMAARP